MTAIRNLAITKAFSLFTGIIFLNMGFFLAEVNMLDFQDQRIIENIRNLVITGGLEEERDHHASGGADGSAKAFNINGEALRLLHSSRYIIAARCHGEWANHYLNANYSEIVSPPPESTFRA